MGTRLPFRTDVMPASSRARGRARRRMVKREITHAVIATMTHSTTPFIQLKVCWYKSHHSVTPTTHSSRTAVKMENLDDSERNLSGRDSSITQCSMSFPVG